jgi:hypothetical protein
MANTYSFYINEVDVHTQIEDLQKVIYRVHWTYTGSDENGIEASWNGTQEISAPNPENFIAFDSLVQADIISWIEPLLNIEALQINIDTQIAEKVAPSKQTLQVPVSLGTSE